MYFAAEKRSYSARYVLGGLLLLVIIGYAIPVSRAFMQSGVAKLLVGVQEMGARFRERGASEQEQRLVEAEARLASFVVSEAKMAALQEENDLLRKQGNYPVESGFELVGAQVLSRVMTPDRAQIIINRGADDRVEVGQAILGDDGVLLGKITSLSKRTATIELLTDPNSRIAATLSGEQRLLGVVEGRGNGAARMTYIPSSQAMKKDQIIVTSGTEEKIPAHIPLGLVNAVEGKSTDPFVSAILEPLTPFDRLTLVQVLRPRSDSST